MPIAHRSIKTGQHQQHIHRCHHHPQQIPQPDQKIGQGDKAVDLQKQGLADHHQQHQCNQRGQQQQGQADACSQAKAALAADSISVGQRTDQRGGSTGYGINCQKQAGVQQQRSIQPLNVTQIGDDQIGGLGRQKAAQRIGKYLRRQVKHTDGCINKNQQGKEGKQQIIGQFRCRLPHVIPKIPLDQLSDHLQTGFPRCHRPPPCATVSVAQLQ